ncbi:MAG: putative restriction endonuclease [Chloroflexota bacterium]|jgi:putative restriction endonuclease|nr:putative restriction endonuclease [Chloroflexota bacterium]
MSSFTRAVAAGRSPRLFVGITDWDWVQTLRSMSGLDEANFWQPSPGGRFSALDAGEPFLFKLHDDRGGLVVGGAFFLRYLTAPISMAWEAFGQANGVSSEAEMRLRVDRYRHGAIKESGDQEIGCILLKDPFFLDEGDWFDAPEWKSNIVRGKGYRLDDEAGIWLWGRIDLLLRSRLAPAPGNHLVRESAARYGPPVFVQPRLGQRSFKVAVADAYHRRCAITGEKVLPVLEAGHIRPYAEGGDHRIGNGLLMRRDIHRLFDRGYLTVTPDLKVRVSDRLHAEFNNGHDYLALSGNEINLPASSTERPDPAMLDWHNHERYVA